MRGIGARAWTAVALAFFVAGVFVGAGGIPARFHVGAQGDCQTFAETGKTVCGDFLRYWKANGGLAQQGFPVSDTFQEKSETDGTTNTVQYFERAVFELHPELPEGKRVLLSLLGVQKFRARYGGTVPATVAIPTSVVTATSRTAVTPVASPTALAMPDALGIVVEGSSVFSLDYGLPNTTGYSTNALFRLRNTNDIPLYGINFRVTVMGGGKTLFVSEGRDTLTLGPKEARPFVYSGVSGITGTKPDQTTIQFYRGSDSGYLPVEQGQWAVSNATSVCESGIVQCKFTADVRWNGAGLRRGVTVDVVAHRGDKNGPVIAVSVASGTSAGVQSGESLPVSGLMIGFDQPMSGGGARIPTGGVFYEYYVDSRGMV